jgi:hypothetical protein
MCHRELILMVRLGRWDDGRRHLPILAFRKVDSCLVADFKADKELASALDRYGRQVGTYVVAVRETTRSECEAFLFRV